MSADALAHSPIHTRIWLEEPEPDNPFAARAAYCHGYDVYGQMLGRASWADMVYLLFRGEAPTAAQAALLNALAVALANPGPRDPAVHAAMCGGIGRSQAAACLMAALSVGAGQTGGARDVFLAMSVWAQCLGYVGRRKVASATPVERSDWLGIWRAHIHNPPTLPDDVWPAPEHPPGFDPNGVSQPAVSTPTIVRQTLATLASLSPGTCLPWLQEQRSELEGQTGLPLAMTGVAAAALADLGCSPEQGEMLHLLLRLPGSAVHALEQSHQTFQRFPFYPIDLQDGPTAESA